MSDNPGSSEHSSIIVYPLWFTQAQLQSNATESSEAELALHSEVRGLRSELDEAKRKASRLSQEHHELSLRLEDTEKDKESLKQTVSQLEEAKRQQEKALEKLNKEVSIDSFNTCANDESLHGLDHCTSHCTLENTAQKFDSLFGLSCLLLSVSMSLSPCPQERKVRPSGLSWRSREREHARKCKRCNVMGMTLSLSWIEVVQV